MPLLNTNTNANFGYGGRELADRLSGCGVGDEYTLDYWHTGGGNEYKALLGNLFTFFRTNSDRRYSDRSLMRILRASEGIGDGPTVLSLGSPFRYDEDTEQKTGGIAAALLGFPYGEPNEHYPNGRSKLIVTTAPGWRRKRIARELVRYYMNYEDSMAVAFVNQGNRSGLQFALECKLTPQAVDPATGVVRMVAASMVAEHNGYEFVDSGV